MSIGNNIRTARIERGLTQNQLAESLRAEGEDIGNTAVSNWELGIANPTPDTIGSICKVLGVDANYILGFKSNASKAIEESPDLLEQYKSLFNKDNKLSDEQKKFFIDFLEEKHKKYDESIDNQ